MEKIRNSEINRVENNNYVINWTERNNTTPYLDFFELIIDIKSNVLSFTKYNNMGNIVEKYDGSINNKFNNNIKKYDK